MVGRPARLPVRTTAVNSGRRRRRACAGSTSGGELVATLAPAAGEDGATGPGAHPQPEAVGLGPAAVVRLERALAHEGLPLLTTSVRRGPGTGTAQRGRDRSATRLRAARPAPGPEAGLLCRTPDRPRDGDAHQ